MKITKYIFFFLLAILMLGSAISCNNDLEENLLPQESLQNGNEDTGDTSGESNDDDDDDDDDDNDDNDDELIKHPSLYFVKLGADISQDEVDELLNDLNSEEVWFREEINLRLWNTTAFPYADASGEQTTNIDGQIARAKSRTRVTGATFNLGGVVGNPALQQQLDCFEETIDLSVPGDAEIKISIFDTGIDDGLIPEFSGHDYVDDDETPDDPNGHGSQVAGLIYSLINQNGMAENITFDIRRTHDGQGLGYLSDLIPAILDAVNEGANILNFSFNYQDINEDTTDRPMRLAIEYAEQNDVLILAAAGNINRDNDNDPIISFPASYPNANIISNAALSCAQQLSSFSSYGISTVDLAFLGENIHVTGLNGSSAHQSGTSFSTACITAMAAIMASHQQSMNGDAIKCALINNSQLSDDLKDLVASQGFVDFQAALTNMEGCGN